MSVRTRELLGLIPVSLLVCAGFAAVLVAQTREVSDLTATYGAVFLGLCVFGHLTELPAQIHHLLCGQRLVIEQAHAIDEIGRASCRERV